MNRRGACATDRMNTLPRQVTFSESLPDTQVGRVMISSSVTCRLPYAASRGLRRPASLASFRPNRQPAHRELRTRVMAFTITLDTPDGEKKIECDESTYILDAADEAGLDLPYSCRSGSCGTCAAKVASGDISQINQACVLVLTVYCSRLPCKLACIN